MSRLWLRPSRSCRWSGRAPPLPWRRFARTNCAIGRTAVAAAAAAPKTRRPPRADRKLGPPTGAAKFTARRKGARPWSQPVGAAAASPDQSIKFRGSSGSLELASERASEPASQPASKPAILAEPGECWPTWKANQQILVTYLIVSFANSLLVEELTTTTTTTTTLFVGCDSSKGKRASARRLLAGSRLSSGKITTV